MTRRSLRVWTFAIALLSALAVSARAVAKPPDLPVDPIDTIPILAPPPFYLSPPSAETTPPMPEAMPAWPTITIYSGTAVDFIGNGPPSAFQAVKQETHPITLTFYPGPHGTSVSIDPSPMPAPQTMTIYHPVRPIMPLSVQYTFDQCLLFGANPLLTLVPLPESLREEQHTQEVIPVPPMPQAPLNGVLIFGVGLNSDAGLTGSIEFATPPVCSCPCDRYVPAIADIELSNSIMENLDKLIEAETLYQQACQLVKNADYGEALACLKKACSLCPASRYQEMAVEVVSSMVWRVFSGQHEDADAEEQEDPPNECEPYWYDDDAGPRRMLLPDSTHEHECPPACGMPCEKAPGVQEQVTGLMKACHLALGCGQHAKAAQLAREAYALDAERVAADPIVYKMHLLALKMGKGKCCCGKDCPCENCDDPDCCCHAKDSAKGCMTLPSGHYLDHAPQYCPPTPVCPYVELPQPVLPPVDPSIAIELQKLFDEANVEVSKAKPNLELIEEESEAPEAPKAVAKPFRVQSSQTGTIITYDDLLRFIPGETWTEIDLKTKRVRVLWRLHVGDKVYRVRYDGGFSVDLNVMPPTGAAENCEDPR